MKLGSKHKTFLSWKHGKNYHLDGLMQERRNSIANTLELCLSCTNPSLNWLMQERRISIANAMELRLSCTNPSICKCQPLCPSLIVQYIPRNMNTVFALLCFVVVIHWLIFPYPSGLLHWHCGNLTIAPVPAKQPWWIWINTSCESIMNDCITTTKQSTTKPCAYFLGYTVSHEAAADKGLVIIHHNRASLCNNFVHK